MREREAASEVITTVSDRRRELLLRDGTDAEIEELERDTDRRHRDLERLELLEIDLLRQLSELRTGAREAEWNRHFYQLMDRRTKRARHG